MDRQKINPDMLAKPQSTKPAADEAPPFEVVTIDGKGLGLVAVRPLKCGDLIVAEMPSLTYPGKDPAWCEVAQKRLDTLHTEQRALVMELHDAFETPEKSKSLEGILKTNSLSRGMSVDGVLCCTVSRMNHSCTPNCDWCWDEEAIEVRIYAATDITVGEELCIYYLDIRAQRADRRRQLSERYRFDCNCIACTGSVEAIEKSDNLRSRMQQLLNDIEAVKGAAQGESGVRMVCELLDLYDQEGIRLRSYRKRACYFAFQFSLAMKDRPGTKWWVQRAYEHSVMCHGLAHEQTRRIRGYMADPNRHPASGGTSGSLTMLAVCMLGFVVLYYTMSWTWYAMAQQWSPGLVAFR